MLARVMATYAKGALEKGGAFQFSDIASNVEVIMNNDTALLTKAGMVVSGTIIQTVVFTPAGSQKEIFKPLALAFKDKTNIYVPLSEFKGKTWSPSALTLFPSSIFDKNAQQVQESLGGDAYVTETW